MGTFVYETYIFIYKENDALISSTPQYTFIPNRPLITGFIHNIHWVKGLELKFQEKNGPKKTKNVKFATFCWQIVKNHGK